MSSRIKRYRCTSSALPERITVGTIVEGKKLNGVPRRFQFIKVVELNGSEPDYMEGCSYPLHGQLWNWEEVKE